VGDVIVVTFLPGLTYRFESYQQVSDVVAAVGRPRRLLLNLSHLRLVPSVFLSMLVELQRRMALNPSVEIFGVEPESLRAFTATRLDELFRIYDDEQSAFNSFRPPPSKA
jgi:anti-anti-sigma regulatory factor